MINEITGKHKAEKRAILMKKMTAFQNETGTGLNIHYTGFKMKQKYHMLCKQ